MHNYKFIVRNLQKNSMLFHAEYALKSTECFRMFLQISVYFVYFKNAKFSDFFIHFFTLHKKTRAKKYLNSCFLYITYAYMA